MNKNSSIQYIALISIAICSCLIFLSSNSSTTYDLSQMVRPPKMRSEYRFAGENIPMNIDTKERLEKELLTNSYFHTSTILAIKNSTRFFPMIEKILNEEGVPEDFKYLAVAESNLSNATSPAGAKGLWQFMKGTALDYGLEVSTDVDERFHYEKSTRAACKYIKTLKNQSGSWVNAAASYNMGFGNFSKNSNLQGEKSYFDLNLVEETSRYVFRIIALKEILSDPESFGFLVEDERKHSPHNNLKDVEINSTILNLGDFAHQNKVSYRLLKYYNPWLIDSKVSLKGKPYLVKIPVIE
jgi:membrane-bound lytic murein transglycosylase D